MENTMFRKQICNIYAFKLHTHSFDNNGRYQLTNFEPTSTFESIVALIWHDLTSSFFFWEQMMDHSKVASKHIAIMFKTILVHFYNHIFICCNFCFLFAFHLHDVFVNFVCDHIRFWYTSELKCIYLLKYVFLEPRT